MRPYIVRYSIQYAVDAMTGSVQLAQIIPGHSKDEVEAKLAYWSANFYPNTIVPPRWKLADPFVVEELI